MSTKIIRNPAENCEILVSAQEEKYRKKILSFEDTKDKLFKCTVCNVNLTPFIEAGKSCHLHSFLKVLVCKKCLDFYGDGYFSTDEDGDEKFCRWCGQGGKLFLCEKCNGGFCRACVKRNFNRAVFEDLKQQDNWDCFICDPKPLYELRAKAWVAEKHYLSLRKDDKKSKMKTTTPEEDEQKEKKSKECKSFRAEQKFIDTARKLLLESLDESIRLADQCKMQAEKIQKTKMSKKRVKDVEAIKSLESKLHVFFNSITENVEAIKFNLTKNLVDWQVLYDERFPKQTNGEGKTEENGCDEEEKKMDEEEEKVEDGEKVENGDVEDDEKDEVENGDEKDEDDAKKDEVKEEENDEPMETSLNETNQSESTTVHGADESIDADKSTIAEDSDCEEPASKIPKKT